MNFLPTAAYQRASLWILTGLVTCLVLVNCKSREDDENGDDALLTALANSEAGTNSNFNGTVTDSLGNVWMKCAYGQVYEADTDQCTGTGGGTTFGAQSFQFCESSNLCTDTTLLQANEGPAFDACDGLSLAGLTDWRLPDYTEMVTLINGQSRDSFLVFFPQTPDDKAFWSRNEANPGDSDAQSVSFAAATMGTVDTENKVTTSNYIRCISPID